MEIKMRAQDILLIRMVEEGKSIPEMAAELGISTGGVHHHLRLLEREEFILPPPRAKLARSRRTTFKGREALRNYGLEGSTDNQAAPSSDVPGRAGDTQGSDKPGK
jgi:predicted ArsR family transcriptional regulator